MNLEWRLRLFAFIRDVETIFPEGPMVENEIPFLLNNVYNPRT